MAFFAWRSNISIIFIVNSKIVLVFETELLHWTANEESLRRVGSRFVVSAVICLYEVSETKGGPSLLAALGYKRLFPKACTGCKRFFLKERKNAMILNKINFPHCLVVFFVVCPHLRPFRGVFGELALLWCSSAKRKTRPNSDFRGGLCSRTIIPLKNYPRPQFLPPQSRDVAVPCPFTRFAIPPTDH